MSDRTRLSLTAEEREVLAHCVKSTLGLVQIAVATGARGEALPDTPCDRCHGIGRLPAEGYVVCKACDGRGHNANTALARKVEVSRRLLARLEGRG